MDKILTRKGTVLRLTVAVSLLLSSVVTPMAQTSLYTPYPEDGREIDASPELGAGCDTDVYNALANANNYSYNQVSTVSSVYIREPTTFFGCLQGLLNQANSLLNMFNGLGVASIAAILENLAASAVSTLIADLENEACNVLTGAISGSVLGTSVTNLLGGGPYATATAASGYTGDMQMALDTMGASIAGATIPYVAAGSPYQYGYPTNVQLVSPTGQDNETTDEANPVANPSSGTLVNPVGQSNPPPLQPLVGNQQQLPSGTQAYNGTVSKTYQRSLNVVAPEYIGPTEQCASLTETLTGIPSTPNWRVGTHVQGLPDLAPGTAIATFNGPGGTYITPGSENQHTGLYLSQTQSCMSIFEQWKGSKPHIRCMLWQGLGGAASRPINRGTSYYVILN